MQQGAGAETTIATVSRSNGVFSTEWTPGNTLLGEAVVIRAYALNNAGGEIQVGGADVVDERLLTVSANTNAVDISNAPGSSVGAFVQPYGDPNDGTLAIISGTTSNLEGNSVELQDQDGVDDPRVVSAANGGEYGEPANGVRTFKGIVDFGSYDWDDVTTDGVVDQAVVQAEDGSDDNEAVSLYKQKITTVTATAANANPPASNPNTTVTVTVKDQNGAPIAGAQVVREDRDGDGTDVDDVKYTDVNGQAKFAAAGDANGETYTYTVNTDDDQEYNSTVDFQRTVTVSTYSDTATAVNGRQSELGGVLDFDEYDEAPVTIKVVDDKGAGKNGATVNYQWTVTAFDEDADPRTTTQTAKSETTGTVENEDGIVTVDQPTGTVAGTYTLNAWIERDGNPGRSSGDLQMAPLTVKMGNAVVEFVDGKVAQAQAGTTKTFDAKLVLEDDSVLPGREVTFSYAPGNEDGNEVAGDGDSIVSASQPTGTTRISNNSAKDTDRRQRARLDLADRPVRDPAAGRVRRRPQRTDHGRQRGQRHQLRRLAQRRLAQVSRPGER